MIPNTLLLFVSIISIAQSAIICPDSTLEVLKVIYDSMGGNGWRDNNWLDNDYHYCEWSGVECDGKGEVIRISLSNKNLSGPISRFFSCLPYLKWLDLSNNNLTSSLDSSWLCKLNQLKYLNLESNFIYSPIPQCICDLSQLMYLHLGNNFLEGEIPRCFSKMIFLREFTAECNNLEGEVPEGLANSNKLESFSLNCNTNILCGNVENTELFNCDTLACTSCSSTDIYCPSMLELGECGMYGLIE